MNVAVIGGGVIGLSLAFELSQRSHQVSVFETGEVGKKASWAGAGALLPANAETAQHPLEHLEALSNRLHSQWAESLRQLTDLDNGYRKSGGLYVASSPGEVATLAGSVNYWNERKIPIEVLDRQQLLSSYPELCPAMIQSQPFMSAYTPDESQICNPWHLEALCSACQKLGARILPNTTVQSVESSSNSAALKFGNETQSFDAVVWACGAWTEQAIGSMLDIKGPAIVPVRGQMLLYLLDKKLELPIVNEGNRYIVSRDTGHVLVGATIEEVGFDETTTESAVQQLASDAQRLIPALTPDRVLKSWAGLRPGTFDSFPFMGKLPDRQNLFVSTGHFKTGLQLSPGAAILMADLIEGKEPSIEMSPFDPSRVLV